MANTIENTIKAIRETWSVKRVSILLTIIAFILWSYSTLQAKLNIGSLGLITSFPVTFFIALGFLAIASAVLWLSKEKHEGLLFCNGVFSQQQYISILYW